MVLYFSGDPYGHCPGIVTYIVQNVFGKPWATEPAVQLGRSLGGRKILQQQILC